MSFVIEENGVSLWNRKHCSDDFKALFHALVGRPYSYGADDRNLGIKEKISGIILAPRSQYKSFCM